MGSGQQNFSRHLKDGKWGYKVIAFVLALFGLVTLLVSGIVNIDKDLDLDGTTPQGQIFDKDGNSYWDYDSYVIAYFAFFTTQTNVIVALWFLIAAIHPEQEGTGKLLSYTGSLLIGTYISITCIIGTTILFPGIFIFQLKRPAYEGPASIALHVIVPIMYLLYLNLGMTQTKKFTMKEWVKRSGITLIYPVLYGVVMLIRGEVRLASGYSSATSYPYFFLQIHDVFYGIPGGACFLGVMVVILAISFGFSTLYAGSIEKHRMNKGKNKVTV